MGFSFLSKQKIRSLLLFGDANFVEDGYQGYIVNYLQVSNLIIFNRIGKCAVSKNYHKKLELKQVTDLENKSIKCDHKACCQVIMI